MSAFGSGLGTLGSTSQASKPMGLGGIGIGGGLGTGIGGGLGTGGLGGGLGTSGGVTGNLGLGGTVGGLGTGRGLQIGGTGIEGKRSAGSLNLQSGTTTTGIGGSLGLGQSGGGLGQSGGLGLGQSGGLGLGQSGGLGLGQSGGLGLGQSGGLGLGQSGGLGLGQSGGLGLGQSGGLGLGQSGGLGLGQSGGLGLGQSGGLGLGQSGGGLGLGQSGGGLGLGQSVGLGLGQSVGLGLGQSGGGLGLGQSGGLGLGQSGGGLGLGQSGGGLGLGQSGGLGLGQSGGLGAGTSGGLGLGQKGLGLGQSGGGLGLGGNANLKVGTGTQLGGNTAGMFGTGLGGLGASNQLNQYAFEQQMAVANVIPVVFRDERDQVIKEFNQIQACWGTGKGLLNARGQFVEFGNDFNRFKCVTYSRLPTAKDEDGLVGLHLNKSEKEAEAAWGNLRPVLQSLVGQAFEIGIEGFRSLPDSNSELIIYFIQLATLKKVSANDAYKFLLNHQKNKLEPQGIVAVYPKLGIEESLLKSYLDSPPMGFTQMYWEQVKEQNPDPTRLIPVPIVGFGQLLQRMKQQQEESKIQLTRLQLIGQEISDLDRKHALTVTKISQARRKLKELNTRVLKLMVAQEVHRKTGYSLFEEEELLRVGLDSIQSELKDPANYRGRLNELMSQVRLQSQSLVSRPSRHLSLDAAVLEEYKQVIKEQQKGISHLVNIIKEDSEDLSTLQEELLKNNS